MLILDIETRCDKSLLPIYTENIKAPKNIKDPEKIKANIEAKKAEAIQRLAVDQDYSVIACIGIKEDDEKPRLVELEELLEIIPKHTIVTFNGKAFDIPVILKSAIKKGLKIQMNFATYTKRWSTDNHIDLMEQIACNGDYKSLDVYLQIYLGIKKTPIDFDTCTQKELEEHCLEDIENTYKLYQLFKHAL